eukprot:tig00001098_g7051.t1
MAAAAACAAAGTPDYDPSDYAPDEELAEAPADGRQSPRSPLAHTAAAGDAARVREILASAGDGAARSAASLSAAACAAAEAGAVEVLRALAAAGLDLGLAELEFAAPKAPADAAARRGGGRDAAPPPTPRIPICLAAGRGHAAAVRALRELGAPLDGYRDGAWAPLPSPLHAAAAAGHADVARLLLDLGADIEAGHVEAFLALAERGAALPGAALLDLPCAALLSHERAVRFLEGKGLPAARRAAKLPWRDAQRPLVLAAARGDVDSVRYLLGCGARADADGEQRAPLFSAAAGGHVAATRALLEAGARLDAPCAARVPLRRAAPRLSDPYFKAFGSDPEEVDWEGLAAGKGGESREVAVRALEAAAAAGSVETVALLLDQGCDGADLQGRLAQFSALQYAALEGRAPVVALLLERCPSPPEARRGALASPLEIAAAAGHAAVLEMLLERCPRRPPAFWTSASPSPPAPAPPTASGPPRAPRLGPGPGPGPAHSNVSLRRLLLARGAPASAMVGDVEVSDSGKRETVLLMTPLVAACAWGHYECAALLLEAGAKADERLSRFWVEAALDPPFALAALLDAQPQLEKQVAETRGVLSALELAAAAGSAPLVRLLARHGAPVERPRGKGAQPKVSSALGLAASRGHVAAARALLALGADPANPARLPTLRPSSPGCPPDPSRRPTRAPSKDCRPAELPYQVLDSPDNATRRGVDQSARTSCLAKAVTRGAEGVEFLRALKETGIPLPRTAHATAAVAVAVLLRSPAFVRLALELGVCPSYVPLNLGPAERPEEWPPSSRPPCASGAATMSRGPTRGAPDEEMVAYTLEMARLLLDAGAPPDEDPAVGTAVHARLHEWTVDRGQEDPEGRPRTALQAALESPLGLPLAELLLARGAALDAGALRAAVRSRSEPLLRAVFARASPEAVRRRRRRLSNLKLRIPPALSFASRARTLSKDGRVRHRVPELALRLVTKTNRGADPSPLPMLKASAVLTSIPALDPAAEALWRAYRRVEEAREKGGADVDPKDESLALREARSSALPVCLALTSGPAQACRLGFRLTALRLARAAPAPALDEADGEGRTPLHHAVAFGPEMLDVCTALIARGADAGRGVGEGADRQTVLQAHRDVAFLAVLKRASRLCDVYICCGDGEGEAAFAARLREGLEAAHVTCLAREDEEAPAGAEGAPASPLDFLKRASAVVFAGGVPVWRERSELDDEMQGFSSSSSSVRREIQSQT